VIGQNVAIGAQPHLPRGRVAQGLVFLGPVVARLEIAHERVEEVHPVPQAGVETGDGVAFGCAQRPLARVGLGLGEVVDDVLPDAVELLAFGRLVEGLGGEARGRSLVEGRGTAAERRVHAAAQNPEL